MEISRVKSKLTNTMYDQKFYTILGYRLHEDTEEGYDLVCVYNSSMDIVEALSNGEFQLN